MSKPRSENYLASNNVHDTIGFLPPPQALRFSRKEGKAGELEARETGDEHVWDHGKEKEEGHPFPFPSSLAAHHFRNERDVWERGRFVICIL